MCAYCKFCETYRGAMRSLRSLNCHVRMLPLLAIVGWCGLMRGQEKHLLAPQDCTELRYLPVDDLSRGSSLQESPDHSTIAYVVQQPNISTNDNQYALYIVRLNGAVEKPSKPLLIESHISELHWLSDSKHIAALTEIDGNGVLVLVDTETAALDTLSDRSQDVGDYSMDRDGEVFAISVKLSAHLTTSATADLSAERGYRVGATPEGYAASPRMREIHIIRRSAGERWKEGAPLTFVSALMGKTFSSFRVGGGMDISLSPNGRYVLVDSIEALNGLPSQWETSPHVQMLKKAWGFLLVSYLYDLSTNTVSIPLQSPVVRRHAMWSPDSRSFARVALPPVGSIWEEQDLGASVASDRDTHLFTVDIPTGEVSEVLVRATKEPLVWTQSGVLSLQTPDGSIRTFERKEKRWIEKSSFQIPLLGSSANGPLTTDGSHYIGEYQQASTPPELFEYDAGTLQSRVIVKLNPEAEQFVLPQTRRIQWTTSTGFRADGVLLLPPDYDPKRRYPIVIENGSILYNGDFVCDSGMSHVSSFVRGMLADDGIMYLMRSTPSNDNAERNYYPKGYPGGIAEAVFKMDLVGSAIQYLDSQKMIDPTNVGLLGFSRGGWYTEFALAHSHLRFRAASATDNVLYSYGSYWYIHSDALMQLDDSMYDGPPYGETLKNWKDYSISFNTEKIHTPLLKEIMGYGLQDDNPQRPPNNLSVHFELFTALKRQNKPVEMYYYPNEQHQPEHPVARMWSLQRNIDWFRFWLQGYERPNPEDPDQYKRWEHLRELRDADAKATAQPQAGSPKLN
jgi:dipeptidyl aminopeptidase/acylaminoacyl peptidase